MNMGCTSKVEENVKDGIAARFTEKYWQCVMVTGWVVFVGSHIAEGLVPKEGSCV